ncbi:MAG: hypothetical protein IKR57_02300 [Bacilli bacterium]|nr:hypothetical protein [Bacilli bacterium]
MKSFKKLIVLLICVVLLSGCMKSHTKMTIKADKSMDYEQEILIAEALGGDMSSEFNSEQYEKNGFKVNSIKENGYVGYKLTKHYDDIDKLSENKGEEVKLSDYLEEGFNDKVLFKLEKGFFKNTYTAKFKYESMASSYQDELNGTTDTVDNVGETEGTEDTVGATDSVPETTETTTTEDTTTATEDTTTTDTTNESTDLSGLEGLMGMANEMEFTYTLSLPVKADKNNATKVDGKTLTWNLATDKESTIEFSFSLLNLTNIIIVGGGALLLIIIVIVVIVVTKKKKASSDTLIHTDYDPSIAANVGQDPSAVVPQTPEAPMTPAPETPSVPQTDNLQFNLPTEETQVNVVPQEPTFITPAVEDAVNSVTESTPMPEAPVAPVSETPVAPMPEAPSVTIPEAPTVVVPETPNVDQNNNLM